MLCPYAWFCVIYYPKHVNDLENVTQNELNPCSTSHALREISSWSRGRPSTAQWLSHWNYFFFISKLNVRKISTSSLKQSPQIARPSQISFLLKSSVWHIHWRVLRNKHLKCQNFVKKCLWLILDWLICIRPGGAGPVGPAMAGPTFKKAW